MQSTEKTRSRGDRLTAEERREAVIEAAIAEFSMYGLHGASTEAIARRAGISQPYIFRLFGTKNDLFLHAATRVCDRIIATFREAAATSEDDTLHRMGAAFVRLLLSQRRELQMLLQAFSASADAEVQGEMRRRFSELYEYVGQASGASEQEVHDFIANGMLLMVAASLDLPLLAEKEGWARACMSWADD